MKNIFILLLSMLLVIACTDLDQVPPNFASSDSLTEYETVLFAAYGYHFDAVGPMAIFGDFRSDNCFFDETPFTDFDEFGSNALTSSQSNDFFRPFYAALYKSILSSNSVIANSTDATEVGEAKFLRALSYFKLVQVFGDVTVNLEAIPDVSDASVLVRTPKNDVYNNVIIPDLQDAKAALSSSSAADANGRATSNAAQALLGKVYASMGNYTAAATELKAVIEAAPGAGISLQDNFVDIFGVEDDLNAEILFATQMSSTAAITSSNLDLFVNWYGGTNTKADPIDNAPIDADLIAAFDAVADDTLPGGDIRRAATIEGTISVKYDLVSPGDHDWVELRLTDVVMLYAEALNENGSSADEVLGLLDPIRTRAGLTALDPATINTKDLVRQAILDERRLEFACEAQRWFDLVRFDAAQPGILSAEMGTTVSSNYHVFPIPLSEVTSFDEIAQNPGY
ncbi:MAG: RagB/SusD family nutrient uptake outer membrane protein [Bacteroidia bacterium]